MIKRYKLFFNKHNKDEIKMLDINGDFVLYEDYKKIEEENKILKDKITQVIQEHNLVSASKKDDDELFKLFLENFKE